MTEISTINDHDNDSGISTAFWEDPFFPHKALRGNGYGGGGRLGGYRSLRTEHIQSHNYEPDESEVLRAYVAQLNFSMGHIVIACFRQHTG
jgi:hypothetical protein